MVVKIGSKTLANDPAVYARVAEELASLTSRKRSFVLVSSGAIALGTAKLGLKSRPKEIAWLQAAAAAGQSVLMGRAEEEAFAKVSIPVAQVLLTHADLADRTRANNARAALRCTARSGCASDHQRERHGGGRRDPIGDNDQLASLVVPLVDEPRWCCCRMSKVFSTTRKKRVPIVHDIDQEAKPLAGKSVSGVGTGGMASKVEAARKGTLAGASVVVADARVEGILTKILEGEDVGTLFVPPSTKGCPARRHWIAFTLRPRGAILVDRGAAEAIVSRGRSILSVGVIGVRGDFREGDAVAIVDHEGVEIARGLARMSAGETAAVAGRKLEEDDHERVVVHRDDLVVISSG
ncbi:MAG: glutamate 5-kinase [Polyangiaceae bacterium]